MAQQLCIRRIPRRRRTLRRGDRAVIRAVLIEARPFDELGMDAGVVKGAVPHERLIKVCSLRLELMKSCKLVLQRRADILRALYAEAPRGVAITRSRRWAQEPGHGLIVTRRTLRLALGSTSDTQAFSRGRIWLFPRRLAHSCSSERRVEWRRGKSARSGHRSGTTRFGRRHSVCCATLGHACLSYDVRACHARGMSSSKSRGRSSVAGRCDGVSNMASCWDRTGVKAMRRVLVLLAPLAGPSMDA